MIKKLLFPVMLSLFLILLFSGSVFAMLPEDEKLANDLNIKDYNPDTPVLEIDPKLMFNEEKLTRTVVIDGKEYEDVISVNYSGKDYYLWSLAYEYKKYGRQLYSKWASNFEEYIEFRLKDGYGKGVGESYPYHEIVSINGVPWQKTIYKDILLKGIKKGSENANPGGLKDKEELWDMLKDPRYNGFAAEIASGEITKEEALKKAMEYGNETVKKSEIKKENAVTETEVKNKPLIIENGAVLKIGSSIVQFYENSTKTENITMRVSPKVVQGHTVIPLRGVFDHFGAKLSYNGKTEEVTIEINNKEIVLKIGSNKAIVNGKEIKMDTKAIVENGRTLIPLRFVGEKLGYKIEWIGSEQKIIIHK